MTNLSQCRWVATKIELRMLASHADIERRNAVESVQSASIAKTSSCNVYMWMENEIAQGSVYPEFVDTASVADGT